LKERAETAEKLDHVNIAKTFAVGVDHDYFVIVSEHIEGETADSWIVENGPMPADAALRVLRPVLLVAVTTVLGMIPLLQDPFFVAMAATIMFGLAFACVLTMIVVPVLYAIFFRVRENAALPFEPA